MKVTCLEFLACFGEGRGLWLFDKEGGLFSLAGLDEGNNLDSTGWFFFPDGSSVGPSAGRFMPPKPPTAAHTQTIQARERQRREEDAGRETLVLTRRASMEVVVILRDVGQDAEAVGNPKSHHVVCIQQRWNSQLILGHTECLQTTSRSGWSSGSRHTPRRNLAAACDSNMHMISVLSSNDGINCECFVKISFVA